MQHNVCTLIKVMKILKSVINTVCWGLTLQPHIVYIMIKSHLLICYKTSCLNKNVNWHQTNIWLTFTVLCKLLAQNGTNITQPINPKIRHCMTLYLGFPEHVWNVFYWLNGCIFFKDHVFFMKPHESLGHKISELMLSLDMCRLNIHVARSFKKLNHLLGISAAFAKA